MKIPQIQPINNFDELIKLFGDDGKFAERLEQQKTILDAINEKIGTLNRIQDIDAQEARTKSALTEAAAKRREAEEILETAKKEASELRESAEADAEGIRQELHVKEQKLDEAMKAVGSQKTALELREKTAAERESRADEQMRKANATLREAEKIREDFEAKQKRVEAALKG